MKARKLVVYRQMILTSKKSLELLQRLHNHENELAQLPTQFHLMIQERLDSLLTYHEQLLLKYTGKLKPEHSEWSKSIDYVQRNELMEILLNKSTLLVKRAIRSFLAITYSIFYRVF